MEVIKMEGKPLHYDGSVQQQDSTAVNSSEEPFILTDEMRRNIGSNPYQFNKE